MIIKEMSISFLSLEIKERITLLFPDNNYVKYYIQEIQNLNNESELVLTTDAKDWLQVTLCPKNIFSRRERKNI
jgi:hypothetical protein